MHLNQVHRTRFSVSIQRVIRALFFVSILLSMLISGLQPAYAATVEGADGQGFLARLYSSSSSFSGVDLSIGSQALPCEIGEDLIVEEGEECFLPAGNYEFGTIEVQSGAILVLMSDTEEEMGVSLYAYDMTVEEGGIVTADGQGFLWNDGESAGEGGGESAPEHCDTYGSGGGHGGQGGAGGECDGGLPYGEMEAPYTLGSSGGSGESEEEIFPGGAGGGAIEIWAEGSLTVNGLVSANGEGGEVNAGGGSGGSITISANDLFGSGSIQANGGDSDGGAGAGGRIGLEIWGEQSPELNFSVQGGLGYENGEDGSVFPAPVANPPANDDWEAATTVSALPFSDSVDTTSATSEEDDPENSCTGDSGTHSVWYSYTALSEDDLTFSTEGSDYDTTIVVWQDVPVAGLIELTCGDDQESLTVSLTPGMSYLVEVIQSVGSGGGQLSFQAFSENGASGATSRISVSSEGDEGDDDSINPTISSDGRYIAFESSATNLIQDDENDVKDIFVFDQSTEEITRVSVGSSGQEAEGWSDQVNISPDGRYITFRSNANNLVVPDTGWEDVYLYDQNTGDILMVNKNSEGIQGNCWSGYPTVSSDGEYVAYISCADNLVDSVSGEQVYLYDVDNEETTLVSISIDEEGGNSLSYTPSISADGRYVAFHSYSSNLIEGDTNNVGDIFVRDVIDEVTIRVSVSSEGEEANGISTYASISADGRYVAFSSLAYNLVDNDTNGTQDIFVYDRDTGETKRVSVSSDAEEGDDDSSKPVISADGRYVTFASDASNLVSDDTNGETDIFIHDIQTGETSRLSVNNAGEEGDMNSIRPVISGDGRFVAFYSFADNLVDDDTNDVSDIFVRDRDADADGNDDFENATPIAELPFVDTVDTTTATKAYDDPILSCSGSAGFNSVWYSYTPTIDGILSINTENTDYETVVAIWTGNEPAEFEEIACHNEQSLFTTPLASGETYWIEIVQDVEEGGGELEFQVNLLSSDILLIEDGETVTVDNDRYDMIGFVESGDITIPFDNTSASIGIGDEILIITMLGGDEDIGTYETAIVESVGADTLTLTAPITNYYEGDDDYYKVMVQRVPSYSEVIIYDGGTLTAHAWDGETGGVVFFRADDLTIESGGKIDVSELGHWAGEEGVPWSDAHGDFYAPMFMGRGGEEPYNPEGEKYARGGGVIYLDIANTLTINGSIFSHGQIGATITGDEEGYEGGGGGSIWIKSHTILGDGTITSIGGAGGYGEEYSGWGGDGGRIAIENETNDFNGDVQAYGGSDEYGTRGTPGTIYWADEDRLIIDNNGEGGGRTVRIVEGEYDISSIELYDDANLYISGTGSNLILENDTVNSESIHSTIFCEGTITGPANFQIENYSIDAGGELVGVENLIVQDGELTLYAYTPLRTGRMIFTSVSLKGDSLLTLIPYDSDDEDYTNDAPFELESENIIVEPIARISSDSQGYGYSSAYGPGAGSNYYSNGYGGYAGGSEDVENPGMPYGDFRAPTSLGSGGGGGAIHLIVDTLSLDGVLSANGSAGSGGSIWIEGTAISGGGNISASSGWGWSGGGRIAIDVQDKSNYTGTTEAFGGYRSGGEFGGPGTIYWVNEKHLIIDNLGRDGEAAALVNEENYALNTIDLTRYGHLDVLGEGSNFLLANDTINGDGTAILAVSGTVETPETFIIDGYALDLKGDISGEQPDITLESGGELLLHANTPLHSGPYIFGDIQVKNGSTLTLDAYDNGDEDYTNDVPFNLNANTLTVEEDGLVRADGLGYTVASRGLGAGLDEGGAGHGGEGGDSENGTGGTIYGSLEEPVALGSSGENGNGGGAVVINAANATIEGILSANGVEGCGGGSGGSIWLDSDSLYGSGAIQANGGNGNGCGGGGGGRIAIYADDTYAFSGEFTANGGAGYEDGQEGTLFLNIVDPTNSTLSISPSTVPTDGSSEATITITLLNAVGSPVIGKPVEIALASGGDIVHEGQNKTIDEFILIGNSNASGEVTVNVSAESLGERNIKARSEDVLLEQQGIVEFVPGPVNKGTSSIESESSEGSADGSSPVNITVTLRDIYGNPISGATVTLAATGGAVVTQPTAVTNVDGVTVGSITDSTGESVHISASANGVTLSDTVSITFIGADLVVTKTGPADSGFGLSLAYALSVRNDGLATAENVVLTDILPNEISYISDDANVDVSQDGQALIWALGSIAPAEQVDITLEAEVIAPPQADLLVVNTLSALSDQLDENPDDNTTEITTPILGVDVGVTKNAPAEVGFGEELTYTLIVSNDGPAIAPDVILVDTLPEEVIYVSDDAIANMSQNGQELTWALGSIAVGEEIRIELVTEVTAAYAEDLLAENTVTVTSNGLEENPIDNTDNTVTALLAPDLTITKTGPTNTGFGLPVEYTLSLQNNGTVTASNVVLTDTLPNGLLFVSDTASVDVNQNGQELTWSLGDIASGEEIVIVLTTSIADGVTPGQIVTNTATVAGDGVDENPDDNTSSATTTLIAPDLGVALSATALSNQGQSSTYALAGETISYTITVENTAEGIAENVTVTDTLPDGLSFVPPTDGYPYTRDGNTIIWNIGNIAAGSNKSIDFIATIGEAVLGEITNTVSTATTSPEEDLTDNTATLNTIVEIPVPVLEVSPLFPTLTVLQGESGDLAITILNDGMGEMSGITVTSPPNIPWVTVDTAGLTQLAPGASADITLTATVDANQAPGHYRDFVIVSDDSGGQASVALTVHITTPSRPLMVTTENDQGQTISGATLVLTKQEASVLVTEGVTEYYYFSTQANSTGTGRVNFISLEVGTYDYTLNADDHETAMGVITIVEGEGTQIQTFSLIAQPKLTLTPNELQVGVVQGETQSYDISIRNNGAAPMSGLTVSLPSALPWVAQGIANPLPEIAPGESLGITFIISPPADLAVGTYQDFITVTANGGLSQQAALTIEVVAAAARDLVYSVEDEEGAPITSSGEIILVQQDSATLQLPGGEEVPYQPQFKETLDGNGIALFSDLTPGEYNYLIQSEGYSTATGTIQITSGTEAQTQLSSLSIDPFNYSWTVEQIEQEYDITLTLTYDFVDAPPALFVSPQNWNTCNSSQISRNIEIHNPTDITLYLEDMDIVVPGTDVERGDLPESIGPGETIYIPVTADYEDEDAISSGAAGVGFTYLSAPDHVVTFTLNPSSLSQNLEGSETFSQQYAIDLVMYEEGASYTVGLSGEGQPSWITTLDLASSTLGTDGTTLDLAVDPSFILYAGEYIYDAELEVHGSDTSERYGTLHIEATKDENGVTLVHTTFELGDLIYEEKSGYSSGGGISVGGCNESEWNWVWDYSGGGAFTGSYSHESGVSVPKHTSPPTYGNGHQQVRLEILQKMMMEGEGFVANLELGNTSGSALSNVSVDIIVESGETNRTADFNLVPLVPTDLGSLGAGESVSEEWLIIPSSSLNLSSPENFTVRAVISEGGSVILETAPEMITVYPAPDLIINYELPYPDVPCTVFDLKVNIVNQGLGTARNLRFSTSMPVLIDATAEGLPVGFSITSTTVNGVAVGRELNLALGEIAPGEQVEVIWRLETNQPGKFVEFTSDYRQSNYEGVLLPPLISEINTTIVSGVCLPSTANICVAGDCIVNAAQDSSGNVDDTDTKTGQTTFQKVEMAIPTSGGSITFERVYAQTIKDNPSTTLGHGWTHSLDSRLILPDDPEGESGYIFFKANTANRYRFIDNGDGTYTAAPGVVGSLAKVNNTYMLTLSSQDKYIFDLDGKVMSWEDAEGNVKSYIYDASDQLIKVSANNDSRYLELTYDENTRINAVIDHTGRELSFSYDLNGDLVSVTDLSGEVWQYTYDSEHRLTSEIDPLGNTVKRTEYDAEGRVVQIYDGENNLVSEFTYNADGTTTITDAAGNSQTHTYDNRNTLVSKTNPLGATTGKTYDDNFRPATITDAGGNTTSLTWSADGANLTHIEDAAGNETSITYDALNNPTSVTDALGHETAYEYNGSLLTSSTDALGHTTAYTYTAAGQVETITNALGQTTAYTYDAFGQVLTVIDSNGTVIVSNSYDDLGRLVNATDAQGRVTHNEYDAAGRLIRVTQNYVPAREQNDENLYNIVTEYAYDSVGNQISVTDTYGNITQYEYDAAGRLVKTIDPAGNENLSAYNALGQLISSTDALGRTTTYEYDAAGRQISTTDALGNVTSTTSYNLDGTVASTTDALGHTTSYTYDELKRVIATTDYLGNSTSNAYDAAGNMVASTDKLGNTTTYEYDALGRMIRQTDALGNSTQTVYDANGNRIQSIDARGNTTTYSYDELGRMVSVTDAQGNVTTTTYNEYGQRTAVTDAKGNTTSFTYDILGRQVGVTDAQGNTTTTTYDALGRVLTTTDALGNVNSSAYDALGRLISQTNPAGGETGFTYDAVGNQLTVTDPNGHVRSTAYDALNRAIGSTDPNGNAISTTYNEAGQVVSTMDGLGNSVSFLYDDLGRQTRITDPVGNITQYGYDANGNRTSMIDPNGIVTFFEYDALGRLTAVVENYQPAANPTAEINVRTEYTYDANGNRLTITDGNSHVTSFSYDSLNRLASETDPIGNTWQHSYDANGNRLSLVDANGETTSYSYDENNRLTAIDYPGEDMDVAFTYDELGRRTEMADGLGTTAWAYDELNRPTSITDPFGDTVGYSYDAVGNRTGLNYPDGKQVQYSYDPANRLAEVTDWQNYVTTYNYDASNRLTSTSLPNGVISNYVYDDAGRLTNLTHESATELLASYAYTYDARGNRTQVVETLLTQEEAGADTYFSDDLEEGQDNWTTDGGWALVADGENQVWSLNPTNDFQRSTDYSLELTTTVNIPADATRPELTFYDPLSVGSDSTFTVEVTVNDGTDWEVLRTFKSADNRADWTLYRIPLDAYAGQQVRVRFHAVQGSAWTRDTWMLDDIRMGEREATPDLGFPFTAPVDSSDSGNWEPEGQWNIVDTGGSNDDYSWSLNPNNDYQRNTDFVAELNGSISIPVDAERPELRYADKINIASDTALTVDVSTDDGLTWTVLESFNSSHNRPADSGWISRQISLDAYKGETIRLRLRTVQGSAWTKDLWLVDDIVVGEHSVPPAFSYPFEDSFTDPLNTENWLYSGQWLVVSDQSHSGAAALDMNPNEAYQRNTDFAVELTGTITVPVDAVRPELSYYDQLNISSDTTLTIEATVDDGLTWTALKTFTAAYNRPTGSGQAWLLRRIPLDEYRGQSLRLRFRAVQGSAWTKDVWLIDDLRIGDHEARPELGFPFSDDWENGTGNWELGGQWSVVSSQSYNGVYSFDLNPNDEYQRNTDFAVEMSGAVTIPADAVSPEVRYYDHFELASDTMISVEITTDDGLSWTTLESFSAAQNRPDWLLRTISLDGYQGQTIRLRLHAVQGSAWTEDHWFVDDLTIGEAGTPSQGDHPFTDDFENGMTNWLPGGQWTVSSGLGYSGENALDLNPTNGAQRNTDFAVELSQTISLPADAVRPELTWYDQHNLASNTTATIEITVDDGTTWTALKSFSAASNRPPSTGSGNGADADWLLRQVSLDGYQGQSLRIRFRAVQGSAWTNDVWLIDDVRIGEHLAPPAIAYPYEDAVATDVGFGDWLPDGQWDQVSTGGSNDAYAWSLNPGNGTQRNTDFALELAGTLTVPADAVRPELAYFDQLNLASNTTARIEASLDDGLTWTTLESFNSTYSRATGADADWLLRRVSLDGYQGQSLRIRFRAVQGSAWTNDVWLVDDIQIGERQTQTLIFPFDAPITDTLNTENWEPDGQWDIVDTGGSNDDYAWSLNPNNGTQRNTDFVLTLGGIVELPADATNLTLNYTDRFTLASNTTISVEVSSDDGQSWAALSAFTRADDAADWTARNISLQAYAGESIRIRFRAVQGSAWTNDIWEVDDVHITGDVAAASTATPTVLPTATATTAATATPTVASEATPTMTPTETLEPTVTATPEPTGTVLPTATPTQENTPVPTATEMGVGYNSGMGVLAMLSYRTSNFGVPVSDFGMQNTSFSIQDSALEVNTINYTYDALGRLTAADYDPSTGSGQAGDYYHYTYDAVGNRLTLDKSVGGEQTTLSYAYDDANRMINAGGVAYTYDNNGNMLSDGVNTYTYDYANRLIAVNGQTNTSYTYSGLGDRHQQIVDPSTGSGTGVTTNYTLDLAAGLTQVLDDGMNTYLYGNGRIAQAGSTTEYFLGDALGSVRQLADPTGTVTLTQSYAPYGEIRQSVGTSQTNYAFAGENLDANGLTFLRARYYASQDGHFISRDTWAGDYNRPLSLNKWNYTEGNPINFVDPTGMFSQAQMCQSMPTKAMYELCVDSHYGIEPISYFELGKYVQGEQGCYSGPMEYRAPGYLEGIGGFGLIWWGGSEIVYDFATMERQRFVYIGPGVNDSFLGGGVAATGGVIAGFRSDRDITNSYRGPFFSIGAGGGIDIGEALQPVGIGAGGSFFVSWDDILLRGLSWYVGGGLSLDLVPGLEVGVGIFLYYQETGPIKAYAENGKVNRGSLFLDIMSGAQSPWPFFMVGTPPGQLSRDSALYLANRYADVYEELQGEK